MLWRGLKARARSDSDTVDEIIILVTAGLGGVHGFMRRATARGAYDGHQPGQYPFIIGGSCG